MADKQTFGRTIHKHTKIQCSKEFAREIESKRNDNDGCDVNIISKVKRKEIIKVNDRFSVIA